MSRPPRWNDDDLRAAVAVARTYAEVKRRLGLGTAGGNHYLVRDRMTALGLDITHFTRDSRRSGRPWTDDAFRAAVLAASTYPEILAALGLPVSSAHYDLVHRDIRRLDLSRDHLRRARSIRGRRWTDEELRSAVGKEYSLAGVLRRLGLVAAGGNYQQVRRAITTLGLDASHFRRRAWNRGARLARSTIPLRDMLVANRPTRSHTLKLRLIREGLKPAHCELCGWAQRSADGRIPLELDHINGDRDDNRIENLRVVCPNCHSLQPTHRGLNQRRRRS